jgi:hypothetical protein
MLSKCANPSCSTPLVYLREGKIFMIESAPKSQTIPAAPTLLASKLQNRVEHFWLCGPCSLEMTLIMDRERGVQVVQKKRPAPPVRHAAAS